MNQGDLKDLLEVTSQSKSVSFGRDREEATSNQTKGRQSNVRGARSQHPSAHGHDAFKIQHYSHEAVMRAIKSDALMVERKSVGNVMDLSQLEEENDRHLTS